MFETGIRQFRMAMAMVNGRRIKPQLIQRLVADADATLREFGSPGDDVDQLLDGPFADPETRTTSRPRVCAGPPVDWPARSPFYAARFAEAGLDPKTVDLDSISGDPGRRRRPISSSTPPQFVCTDAAPYLSTRTTGTTGTPAEIWLSRYEAELWPAMAALSGLLRNEINHTDCLQINLSSRATAAVQHDIEVCRLVGARSRALGLVPVDQSIDGLLDHGDGGAATILGTYPSYLARLVTAARRRGLGPDDFALRRIDVAGEMLSRAVADGRPRHVRCPAERHVRHDRGAPRLGPDLRPGPSARRPQHGTRRGDHPRRLRAGRAGRARHDGRHPVLPLPRLHAGVPLRHPRRRAPPPRRTAHLQPRRRPGAVGRSSAKPASCWPPSTGCVTPRDIVEVLEALPAAPWPAQYRAAADGGVLRLTIPPATARRHHDRRRSSARFAARGIDCTVDVDRHRRAAAAGPRRPRRDHLQPPTAHHAGV